MANLTSLLWLLTCEVLHCHSPAALPLIIPQYFYFRVFYSVSKVLIVTSFVLAFSSHEPLFICRYQINLSRVMVGNFFRETNWFSSILGMHFPVKVNIIDHKSTCFYLLWVLSKPKIKIWFFWLFQGFRFEHNSVNIILISSVCF